MAEPSFPTKLPSSPMTAAPVGPPMAYLTEIRKESPASAVAFADACPCCGNKKRRCLYPSDDPRKKILVFDLPPTSTVTTSSGAPPSLSSPSLNASYIRFPSSSTADPSPSPSPNPKRTPPPVLADRGSLGWHSFSDTTTSLSPPPEVKNPVADSGSGRAPTLDRGFLERTNSSAVTCSAVEDKSQSQNQNQSQGSDDISVSSPKPKPAPAPAAVRCSAEKVKGRGEVRIGVKCECGLTREIIFIQ